MRTQMRSILAAGVLTASLGAGCVAIIATDTDDHYADDCGYCHYEVYYKQTGDDSTAVAMDTTDFGPCTR
jgi:hypothetical protein